MKNKLTLIEFNEVNIPLLRDYIHDAQFKGRWPNLLKLLQCETCSTISEQEYENLEPWIQWVSVHTGQSAADHGVFRLGDISHSKKPQIFELVEKAGYRVGVVAAMNAENRLKNPAFFVPDPWTVTSADSSWLSRSVYKALNQAVNDNSKGKISLKTFATLIIALILKSKKKNWILYLKVAFRAFRGKKWNKALFLDIFISDLFINLSSKKRSEFSTLFLNAFAHIQHHYYFSSKFYDGPYKNPEWYVAPSVDPLIEALDVYDKIFENIFKSFCKEEVLVATGLSQRPYSKEKIYYRLREHAVFLEYFGISNCIVYPRMTRDFLVEFYTDIECEDAKSILEKIKINGIRIFEHIEKRQRSLFVTLTYPHDISDNDKVYFSTEKNILAKDHIVFVAIKNGMHDGTGYAFSTEPSEEFSDLEGKHVKLLHNYILGRFATNELREE